MIAYSKTRNNQIDQIAACLAVNFVKPLFDFRNEKSYSVYVKSLAEILNWAHEFYSQYHHKMKDWEAFEKSSDNIYNGVNQDDFLIEWGHNRIRQFFAKHGRKAGYFPRNPINSDSLRRE